MPIISLKQPSGLSLHLVLAVLCLLAHPLAAESGYTPLSAEAASSLFDVALGGSEAELFVKGSWNLGLTGQAGLVLDGKTLSLASDTPLAFAQTPDLYLSFLLFGSWFVEARVSSDIAQTRYAAGFRGDEGDFLKDAHAGNYGISFPVLPFLSFGAGSYRSFGAVASFASAQNAFTGHAMVRYDQATRVEKRFVGNREVKETLIALSAFQRGKWFVLPDPPVSGLEVYVASVSGSLSGGDGLAYRKLEASEYSLSASRGFLSLSSAASTKVLAYWQGLASGTVSGLAEGACLVLYDPDDKSSEGLSSATQALGRYSLSVTDGMSALVRDSSTGLVSVDYEVALDSSGFAAVSPVSAGSAGFDPQEEAFRQPFAEDAAWIYSTDFSEDAELSFTPAFPYEIVVRSYSSASKISIDTDVIEGSVEVSRNGVPDYAFTVDASGGTLSLATEPGLEEEIVVSYLKESSSRSTGSLALGLGGIFDLGAGRKAWTALGLRWSFPGTSYASSGVADPGSLVFTLGEKDAEGDFRQNLAIGASWSTEVASGAYRLEGMESTGTGSSTSFWKFQDTGAFTVEEKSETLLKSSFPSTAARLHGNSDSVQKALYLTADGAGSGGDLFLAKYVEEVPVSGLKTFSFFARRESSTGSSATICLALDSGSGASISSAAIEVSLPASVLDSSWKRFIFKYGYGVSALYCQSSDGGSLDALAGGDALTAYDPTVASARRLAISVKGAAGGDTIWLDELMFEESSGRAALIASGGMSYEKADFLLGQAELPLVKGLKLSTDATGSLADSSYVSGGASLETAIGAFGLKLQTRGSASEEEAPSFRGGHSLVFPNFSFPLVLADVFSLDPSSGDFGRESKVSLNLGSLAAFSAGETSTWASDEGDFEQAWSGSLSLAGGFLSAGLAASNLSSPAFTGLSSSYFESWKDAWAFILPSFEGDSSKRAVALSLASSLGGSEIAKAKISVTGLPLSSSDYRDEDILLRIQLPLKLKSKLSLIPYYQREWVARYEGAGSGLIDLSGLCVADALGFLPLWESLPFTEILDSKGEGFAAFAEASALSGLEAMSLVPEAGLSLARNYGSLWTDLVFPSSLSLALKRDFEKEADSLSSALMLEAGAKFGAINLFGSLGSLPFFSFYESEDYSSNYKASLAFYEGEANPRLSLLLQHVVTFYGRGNKDSLALDNRFALSDEPSKSVWSENLSLSLSLITAKSWLLDLYRLVLSGQADKKPAPAEGKGKSGAGTTVTSRYLSSLAKANPVTRSIISVSAVASSSTTDETAAALSLDAKESFEFRLTVPEKLSLSAKPYLTQNRDADTAVLSFNAALYIGATISF